MLGEAVQGIAAGDGGVCLGDRAQRATGGTPRSADPALAPRTPVSARPWRGRPVPELAWSYV